MFGSPMLDVAIGLIFIFLLLSIIASAFREAIEGVQHSRAAQLERGMRELLADSKGTGLSRAVYSHPLICSMYQGSYEPEKLRGFFGWAARRQLPSYLPKENFALALIDMVVHGTDTSGKEPLASTTAIMDTNVIRARLSTLGNPRVERVILTALDSANGDMVQLRRNIEDWFDGSMDRVSGWYKRHTQFWLLAIGVTLAVGGNVDTLGLAQYLNDNKGAREILVAEATTAAKDSSTMHLSTEAVSDKLDALKLPIGWSHIPAVGCNVHTVRLTNPGVPRDTIVCTRRTGFMPMSWDIFWMRVPSSTVGWLMTALAITFGAPFWFDVLNKFMVIRSTVKPKEKSGDEGSKDKGSAAPPAPPPPPPPAAPNAPATASETPVAFEHSWASGDPQEGVL